MVNFGDETTLNSDECDATIWMEEDSVSSHEDSSNQNNTWFGLVAPVHRNTSQQNTSTAS
jgi:hypothetical protein